MKKIIMLTIATLFGASFSLQACRNTISNNTNITFKVAEVTEKNPELKQQVFLPDAYITDEKMARTLKPGDETDFGGHYLPRYIIYKEFKDKKWRPLIYVVQFKCAPDGADPSRFPENKYLLITDLLRQTLPDDYQQVYKFTVKAQPAELMVESANKFDKIKNPYQELNVLLDNFTQQVQELFSNILKESPAHQYKKPEVPAEEDKAEETGECQMCKIPEAA